MSKKLKTADGSKLHNGGISIMSDVAHAQNRTMWSGSQEPDILEMFVYENDFVSFVNY